MDIDYLSRKLRRPKIETQEEVTQRMKAVELAVKEALLARGEKRFTDQEFPPTDQSLFVDPDHPSAKLQVRLRRKYLFCVLTILDLKQMKDMLDMI